MTDPLVIASASALGGAVVVCAWRVCRITFERLKRRRVTMKEVQP